MKKKKTQIEKLWDKLSKESKQKFWEDAGKLSFEIQIALRVNDIPNIRELLIVEYGGKNAVEKMRALMLKEKVNDLLINEKLNKTLNK